MIKKSDKLVHRVLIIIFLFLVFPAYLFNQLSNEIEFERISIEEGLSQSSVFCMLQDSRGFMWFGTENGLNRYDGHTFKFYNYSPMESNSLSYNIVISLHEDRRGNIWIGTWGGGLNKFDRKTEKFTIYKNAPRNHNSLSNDNVWSIYEDKSGILWIGTDKGLNIYNREEEHFKNRKYNKDSDDSPQNKVRVIYEDKAKVLWIGTDGGLLRYNQGSDDFDIYKNKSKDSFHNQIRAICEDKGGSLWIGTVGGLYRFDRKKERFLSRPDVENATNFIDSNISAVWEDQSGILWIGTRGDGIFIFNPKEKRFKRCRYMPNVSDSLSQNEILAIYEDKSGLIWIGTYSRGLNKFDPKRKKFDLYRNTSNTSNYLTNNDVMVIHEGSSGIWIGTRGGGVNKFDPEAEEKKFTNYKIESHVTNNPRRNDIRALWEDHSGELWVGTVKAGLYRNDLKKKEKKISPYIKKDQKSSRKYIIGPEEYILTICEDKDDVLWLGTMGNGLIKIGKNREEVKNYKHTPGNPESLSNNKIFSIYEDKSDVLWIGTGGGGLNKFDKEKEIFISYQPSEDNSNSLSHTFISAIYEDEKGMGLLWIGTNGGGLNKFDKKKETFTAYTTQHGLPNNVIYDILEDNSGCLWISTNKGLSRFNPKTETFRNYTVRDGLQDNEFNRGAACKTKSGIMLFGGINGFNIFEPKKLKDTSSPPPIVITAFKKFNKDVNLDTSITEIDKLELSYKDGFISFEFAALSFSNPKMNQYAFMLDPINKDWIPLGNRHDIDFPNLEPGMYTLKIKGSNSDGYWNEEGTSINIKVNPPLWLTWWFISLSMVLIGSIILFLARVRIKNIEKKREELSKTNALLNKEINDRKQAQAELKESEERYRTFVETSSDAITLSEISMEKGAFTMVNRQAAVLLEYKDENEMISMVKDKFEIFTPSDRLKVLKNAEKLLKEGSIGNNEYTLQTKNGMSIPVEISTSLVKDADGNPKYFLSITRDIRERKEAQEKLIQADKMVSLGTLASGVAHEMNNPVSSIMVNSETFSRVWKEILPILDQHYQTNNDFSLADLPYEESKNKINQLISGLLNSSRRIKNFIRELRDFSRPEDSFIRQDVDINRIIHSAVSLTKNMIKKTTNNFILELANNLPIFWGSFQKLEQVFINLIENACKALPDNTRGICISTTYDKKNDQIIIKVKDEGVGIEEKDIKYITNPFFTTRRREGGSGLGLFVSLKIIQAHGGFMKFESQVVKGTTVFVHLPMKPKIIEKIKETEVK